MTSRKENLAWQCVSKTNPLETVYAVLLENGLDGAGVALRILVNEAAKVECSEFRGAAPYERTVTRRDYANGSSPRPCSPAWGS
jgi:putative transposase